MRSLVIVCMLWAGVATARAESPPDSTRAKATQPPRFSSPLSQGLLLSQRTAREPSDQPVPNYLTFSLSPFKTEPYVFESTFDAMLFGAGAAGTLGMFFGAIGNTLGLFDEQTTWAITGAAAAAGAYYGSSRFKIRIGPDESPRPPSDR